MTMGVALNLSLALLVYVASAACEDLCTYSSWGSLSGTQTQLPPKKLSPDVRDWIIEIPIPPQCNKLNGVWAAVCDYVSPRPHVRIDQHLIVHRNSNLVHSATVTIVVYCDE